MGKQERDCRSEMRRSLLPHCAVAAQVGPHMRIERRSSRFAPKGAAIWNRSSSFWSCNPQSNGSFRCRSSQPKRRSGSPASILFRFRFYKEFKPFPTCVNQGAIKSPSRQRPRTRPATHESSSARFQPRKINTGAMGKDSGDDRISSLPNDILVNILDRLDVSDAARISILSRRWSQLSTKLSQLVINPLPDGWSSANISDGDLVRINAAALEATKSILTRRDPGEDTIRLLSTKFYLRGDVPLSIGHAVGDAMAIHKIEKAEFTVLTVKECQRCRISDLVNYGTQFVSFFNECRNAFTGLTRLYLENLRFAESDFVSNIFVTCKRLKYLGFFNCNTGKRITLQIEHAQLSELSLVNCRFAKVELKWLPRLTRTTYKFWLSFQELPLSFGHVPLLEFLDLTNIARSPHKMVRLSTLISGVCVQDLRLGFKCEKIWVQPESLTERLAAAFRRLRIVNLVSIPEGPDLTWTMFILEAAPCLEEFYMSVMDHPCEMEMNKERRRRFLYSEKKGVEWESPRSNFKHRRLTKLIIFCFGNYIVSHLRRIMKAAVNLKDVYLYDRVACCYCQHINPLNPGRLPRNKKKLNAMENLLTQDMESPAKIHFLTPSPRIDADHAERLEECFR